MHDWGPLSPLRSLAQIRAVAAPSPPSAGAEATERNASNERQGEGPGPAVGRRRGEEDRRVREARLVR